MSYLVKAGVSTRRVPLDPKAKLFDPRTEEWISYSPGQIVEVFPSHVPVDELVKSGHLEPIGEAREVD